MSPAGPARPRIGSLCTGYGGLDAAVHAVFGGTTAWVSDIDPGASRILKHRMPDVPNLGDLTTTDWATVEPVDIVCGGYPCQPFSLAGNLKGTADERHIWPDIARALGVLRPRIAIFENVANHLRLGFDTVLADLASLGLDVEWCVVRADEVGAPHQRRRLIIYASSPDATGQGRPGQGVRGRVAERGAAAADAPNLRQERAGSTRGRWAGSADGGHLAADADGHALRQQSVPQSGLGSTAVAALTGPGSAANPKGVGRGEGGPESARQQGRLGAPIGCGAAAPDADRRGLPRDPEHHSRPEHGQPEREPRLDAHGRHLQRPDWGRFAPAVRRWEAATGRTAPGATDDRNRLSPLFVEWLMGLEAGWVTDVPDLSRTQQLHALGNGVVPQQAEAAIRLLRDRATNGTAHAWVHP
ncbi:DNA cytosine methyltransferase [Streptomyces sp. TBY4]|nr:DNA cytosine methyltransferase [Streptomyces sp. TBY4]